jgi:hypothetical protein
MEHVFDLTAVLRRVRHSRMLLAGIQAESGLDPRLKHSGVTILESHLFAPAAIFKEADEGHEVRKRVINSSLTFVLFVVFVVNYFLSSLHPLRALREIIWLRFYTFPSCTVFKIRSGRSGKSLIRRPPNALAIALPIAGSTGPNAASPTPFAPYGPSGCGVSTITD